MSVSLNVNVVSLALILQTRVASGPDYASDRRHRSDAAKF